MDIEESVIYIKEKIKNKLPEYTETFVDGKPYRIDVLQLETRWTEKTAEAIETLLTAYEKEKEKNETLEIELEIKKYCKVNELASDLIYYKNLAREYQGNCISKDKLKEIVDECVPKKENIITRELEYTPNANANSYLTQEILSLLEKE